MDDCCGSNGGKPNGHFDVAVIGAGSAGFSAAITAAEHGAQVALIGHGTIGGTCVNVGCVPSKTLIRAAETLHQAKTAQRFSGIRGAAGLNDWPALIAQKDELVNSLREAKYLNLLPAYNNVAYLEGEARLSDAGVAINGEELRANRVIIATGARAAVPSISGIDTVPYLTSTAALDLDKRPESLVVVGGGYIGCELAQMFARAGTEVTIVCRSTLLPHGEPEISAALTDYFRAEGITVRDGVTYKAVRETENGIALTLTGPDGDGFIEAEKILVATGRTPNTESLHLEEAGIARLPNGGIKVDEMMRTTRDGTYAAGDVTGRDQFVYMAAYGAKVAAQNAVNGNDRRYANSVMPAVVFTDPQIGSVGLTEAEAKIHHDDVRTSVIGLEHVPRALAARDTRGLIKLVADGPSGQLLGAHIIAPEGAESIQTAALAIKYGATATELGDTIFPYLTTVEGLKLAAQAFNKDVAMLSCCAG